MRTTRPPRSPSAFRRTPLIAALAGVMAQQAFAACTPNLVPPNLVFCVTNNLAFGPGSLAQAFNDASNSATCSGSTPTIGFAIPGTGPFTIAPSGTMSLFCSFGPVHATLDGTSQAGYTPNTDSTGFNSQIQIVIDGASSSSPTGISVSDFGYGASLSIKGVEVRNFTYGGFATALSGPINIAGSRVTNNVTGLSTRGIDPDGFGAPYNTATVGGGTTADRNVFRSNSSASIQVGSPGFVSISNNFIGTNDAGTAAAAGNGMGVNSSGWPNVSITNNVIGGSSANAVNASGSAVVVTGNKIGISLFGAALPNGGSGIESGGFPVFIGNNTIANNGLDGVTLPYGGSQVEIRGNRIHTNSRKAINLGAVPSQVPNDFNDPDTGPNDLQNFPVISSVVKDGTNTTINWSLNSTTGTSFDIEFFSNPAASATPQATNFLDPGAFGFTQAGGTTGAATNNIGGTTVIPGSHDFITATAINNATGVTSELTLQALAVGGVLTPTAINFGNIVVNASSGPQNAVINSIGASPYVVSLMSGANTCYGGPPPPPSICSTGGFICSTDCVTGQPYASGSSCTITATFAPTVLGAQSTTVYICDNAGGNPRTLTLTGNAIAPPPPTVAPTSFNFGNVEVGGQSALQTFTVTNPSPASITLSSFAVPAPFQIVTNTCGASLSPSASCSLDARFAPTVAAAASGAITATASSGAINIPLSGNGTPPPMPTINPPSINFGSVQLGGESTPGTFTLTSTAILPVSLTSWSVPAPFQLISTTCGASLSQGQSCTASLKFVPSAVGSVSATVSHPTSAGTPSAAVQGNGTASPPPTIAPLNHDFGAVFLGTSSATQTFTFNNPALLPATLGPVTVTPPFGLVSTTCSNTLAAGSSCTADVKFQPSAVGTASGSVSASVSGGTLSASLTGTGAPPPAIVITPPSFDFGSVLLGTSSASTAFQFKNPGSVTLSTSAPQVTGPFQIVTTTCGTSLAGNQACTADVRFTPTQSGPASGTVAMASQFGTSSAPLQGNGVRQPAVQLPTDPIDFGSLIVGSPPVQRTLRLANTGNAILAINSIQVPAPFTLANACGVSLADGDSCTFTVGFDPAQIGDFAATLTVSTNAPNASSIAIPVRAQVQARPEPIVRVSPRTIGFGDRIGGSQSPPQRVTLLNEGGAAANLNLSVTSSNFVVLNTTCAASLAPRQSCTADVAFQPQGFGPKRGQYVVSSNSADSPIRVELSGAGCRPVQVTMGRGTPPNNCAP